MTASFTAKRAGVDVSNHAITEGMEVSGYAKRELVEGKNKRVWYLDCDWCVANAPVASAPKPETAAGKIAPPPAVGVLDQLGTPPAAPKPATKATKQPAIGGTVTEAVMIESLVAFGERMVLALDTRLAEALAKLPKNMTIQEIETSLISRGSLAAALKATPVTAPVRTPNPVSEGTTLCPATIKSGEREGEICDELVKNPANEFCGRHSPKHANRTAPTPAAPKTAAELASAAFDTVAI